MIALMGAMIQEIEILREHMTSVTHQQIGGRDYFTGKLYEKETTLVFSKYGKVASALTATALFHNFPIKKLIFIGVAASSQKYVKIGDIVLAKDLYQYDMDTRPLFKKYEIPLTKKIHVKTDLGLLKVSKIASLKAVNQLQITIDREELKNLGIEKPKVHIGRIASGDAFVSHMNWDKYFPEDPQETLALEMEGAAVAQVAHEYNKPFIVIRTISDLANKKANHDFARFIKNAAKHYSQLIIENLFRLL